MAAIRFGADIEIDPDVYELRRGGHVVRLERIPMQILLLLVERRPDLVTREQIAEKVWGPGVFVDTDNSINGAIRKVRIALSDDPEHPRYIRTVTGIGYRFVAKVVSDGTDSGHLSPTAAENSPPAAGIPPADKPVARATVPPVPAAESPASSMRGSAAPQRRPSRWRWALVLVPLALAGTLALYVSGPRSPSGSTPSAGRQMLVVLPFENLTGDPAQDYFADGFTEEMIARLGGLASRRLGVIARTSSMHYKQKHASLETIGRELGVQYVLEGSVRRDADRVRITAQLILVEDQSHLWARQYNRQQTDVLTVQEEVAHAIADLIHGTLDDRTPSPVHPGPLSDRDYVAYDLYLKGRYSWNKRTRDDFARAIESFQRSIELNPLDPRAHAGLADAYALMATYQFLPGDETVEKVRAAALEALEIDPALAAPYTALALMNEFFDWDWQGAEERFRKAIELEGNYATAHQWYAEYLAHQGRFDEAIEEIDAARRLDPVSLIIWADRAAILYFARRYPEAIDQFRAVMDVQPLFARSGMVILAYAHEGRYEEALAQIGRWEALADGEPWLDSLRAYLYGRLGRAEDARKALADLEESSRRLKLPSEFNLTYRTPALCGMGLKEEALASLQEACETRVSHLVTLKVDPIYDFLRDDPRFLDLLRCVRLAS